MPVEWDMVRALSKYLDDYAFVNMTQQGDRNVNDSIAKVRAIFQNQSIVGLHIHKNDDIFSPPIIKSIRG